MNIKSFKIIISVGIAFIIWMLLLIMGNLTEGVPSLHRIIEVFGGSSNGYIHALIYAAAIFGLLELLENHKFVKKQYEGFELNLLPVEDQKVISPDEVGKIKLSVMDLEKRGFEFLVAGFIKKTCTQYRNDHNIGDTLRVFESQVENHKNELEGKLEMVRYAIQATISIGFLGTLIGLSSAIGLAHLAKTDQGMPEITGQLNVAFDTTLVALLVGLVLNFLYHRYLEDMDTFYSRTKSYVIDNLISRIYRP